jgi:hypothetical protein
MPSPSSTTRIEPTAIVIDDQHRASAALRSDTAGRLGVASDAGQPRASPARCPKRPRRARILIDVYDRDHSGALLELRAELTQRLIELPIGEDAWP